MRKGEGFIVTWVVGSGFKLGMNVARGIEMKVGGYESRKIFEGNGFCEFPIGALRRKFDISFR